MKNVLSLFMLVCIAGIGCLKSESGNPIVRIETNLGNIDIELDQKSAPKTVENFLGYVNSGFYEGTVFHRVIKGFMIQGGGLTADMRNKPTSEPIVNEADNGLKNRRGAIAMARTNQPHSASSQFFINTVDNEFLNHTGKNPSGWGYCVFGKVIAGLQVVDKIERQPTSFKAGHNDVPVEAIVIKTAKLLKPASAPAASEKTESATDTDLEFCPESGELTDPETE